MVRIFENESSKMIKQIAISGNKRVQNIQYRNWAPSVLTRGSICKRNLFYSW